jgi:hypothetical protein
VAGMGRIGRGARSGASPVDTSIAPM